MALGGGTFTAENKILPGAYMNFTSLPAATATLSDRGTVAIPIAMDWGADGVTLVTQEDFQTATMQYFGYAYTDDAMKPLRDLFLHAKKAYIYKLNSGGTAASCTYGHAKYTGKRGNNLTIVIEADADDTDKWDVSTYMSGTLVDRQVVATSDDLVDTDYVVWTSGTKLEATAGVTMTGGGSGSITGAAHANALGALESYRFNVLICISDDAVTKGLYAAFTKRLRDQRGIKFQCVVHSYKTPDYMGVISVSNVATNSSDQAVLVYWVGGAEAACGIAESLENTAYDGEYTIDLSRKQSELEAGILSGEFLFHSVDGEPKVLEDINTMVTTSDTQGDVFKDNQTIRVIDQIGNDIASLYAQKYLGHVQNDAAGRDALKSDIVSHHLDMQTARAIENFSADDVVVEIGKTKKSVKVTDAITVVNTMSKLYMTVVVA